MKAIILKLSFFSLIIIMGCTHMINEGSVWGEKEYLFLTSTEKEFYEKSLQDNSKTREGESLYKQAKQYERMGRKNQSKEDITMAIGLYDEAIAHYSVKALYRLGQIFFYGIKGMVEKDYDTAMRYMNTCARISQEKKDYKDIDIIKAKNYVALLYFDERSENYQIAFDWLSSAAEDNCEMAIYNLALMYYYGWGMPKNIQKGIVTLARAASLDSDHAKYAYLKAQILNGSKDMSEYNSILNNKIVKLELLSSESKLKRTSLLTRMIRRKDLTEKDLISLQNGYKEKLVLSEDLIYSNYCLGVITYSQKFKIEDKGKAYNYFSKSAEGNFFPGYYYLGWMYQRGSYISFDAEKAKDNYEKAVSVYEKEYLPTINQLPEE